MEVHKRTEITVETSEVLVVRRARVYRGWCQHCARDVEMVGVSDAWAIAGITPQGGNSAGSAQWHFSENEQPALVCLNSVLKAIRQK